MQRIPFKLNRSNTEEKESQDPILVQQSVDDDPEEERHDDGQQEDGFEGMPRTLGTRLTGIPGDTAAPPERLAAAVLARRLGVDGGVAAGVRRRRCRRRALHPHLAQLRHLAGGMTVRLRRRRPEPRQRIHLKGK